MARIEQDHILLHGDSITLTFLGEDQLVDDNVVGVDLVLRQLLNQSLGLIERQELGDADTDKGGLVLSIERIMIQQACHQRSWLICGLQGP